MRRAIVSWDKQARYDAKHARRISLKFNDKTDADVLKRLGEVSSKQGYIKGLIRADIARANASQEV